MKKILTFCLVLVLLLSGCGTQKQANYPIPDGPVDFVFTFLKTGYQSAKRCPEKVLLQNKEEVNAFRSDLAASFGEDIHFYTIISQESLKKYDDTYFEEHLLLIVSLVMSSGGDRYVVTEITKNGDNLQISIQKTAQGMTCDMSGCHLMIELPKQVNLSVENIYINIQN